MSEERWRPIPGWDRYEVSDQGRVRSLHWNPPRLRKHVTTGRYPMVMLKQDGRLRNIEVHALVALAFLGPRPDGMEVAHENGVAHDVRLANLSYKTPVENSADKERHGTVLRGLRHPRARLSFDDVEQIRAAHGAGVPRRKIAAKWGISAKYVNELVNKTKRVTA